MAKNKLQFLEEIGKLKHLERTGWVLCDVTKPETVASHMYRMAVMAMTLKPVDGCDMNKVVRMALAHDMAECLIGDITPHCKVSPEEKERLEKNAFDQLGTYVAHHTVIIISSPVDAILPDDGRVKFVALFDEYEARKTPEACLCKDLDLFDMVLQAFQYERSEFAAKGKIHYQMAEFFEERILKKFRNEEVREWVAEVMEQRKNFHAQLPANVITQGGNDA